MIPDKQADSPAKPADVDSKTHRKDVWERFIGFLIGTLIIAPSLWFLGTLQYNFISMFPVAKPIDTLTLINNRDFFRSNYLNLETFFTLAELFLVFLAILVGLDYLKNLREKSTETLKKLQLNIAEIFRGKTYLPKEIPAGSSPSEEDLKRLLKDIQKPEIKNKLKDLAKLGAGIHDYLGIIIRSSVLFFEVYLLLTVFHMWFFPAAAPIHRDWVGIFIAVMLYIVIALVFSHYSIIENSEYKSFTTLKSHQVSLNGTLGLIENLDAIFSPSKTGDFLERLKKKSPVQSAFLYNLIFNIPVFVLVAILNFLLTWCFLDPAFRGPVFKFYLMFGVFRYALSLVLFTGLIDSSFKTLAKILSGKHLPWSIFKAFFLLYPLYLPAYFFLFSELEMDWIAFTLFTLLHFILLLCEYLLSWWLSKKLLQDEVKKKVHKILQDLWGMIENSIAVAQEEEEEEKATAFKNRRKLKPHFASIPPGRPFQKRP
ncbi:hypothetical protein NXS08_01265 [Gleimia sp. 6138-11-ORH1]|uniref:hypothetical protein n=1 Tax=Gleimia sp. 6138-11-ORH1 TaxID=2973937 RepID=UPI002166EEF9|nr:hypothetical protein [Gleimia sp. 6138-11-ORH1]MCS4484122.1 hypothetical protein [Gleimia sp. 6138-11-ORH1]